MEKEIAKRIEQARKDYNRAWYEAERESGVSAARTRTQVRRAIRAALCGVYGHVKISTF